MAGFAINRAVLVRVIDLLAFLMLVAMISSGAMLEFTLPERSGRLAVWGMTRHQWGDIHSMISLAFLVLMSLHLLLHLRFIKLALVGQASGEQKYRLALGVVCLVILLLLALAPNIAPVAEDDRHGEGFRGGHGVNQPGG